MTGGAGGGGGYLLNDLAGIGQLMASPTDLIKTQIQMEGRRRLLGKPPRVHGSWDAAR